MVFWLLFGAAATLAFQQTWVRLDPLRTHPWLAPWWLERQVARLASPHPAEAVRAWNELERSYLTHWSAYDWIVWKVKQNLWQPVDPPIHFQLRRSGWRYYASPEGAAGECRTVNEALMAILHQEPGWKTAHTGDWRKWWDANWTYFPNRDRAGLPSGPEDPRRSPRR